MQCVGGHVCSVCSVWVGMCAVCGWECVQCGCVQCVGGRGVVCAVCGWGCVCVHVRAHVCVCGWE